MQPTPPVGLLFGAGAAPEAGADGAAAPAELPSLTSADQRWRAEPLRLQEWQSWFTQQLSYSSKAKPENGWVPAALRLAGLTEWRPDAVASWRSEGD